MDSLPSRGWGPLEAEPPGTPSRVLDPWGGVGRGGGLWPQVGPSWPGAHPWPSFILSTNIWGLLAMLHGSLFTFCGCHNKSPQTSWLKAAAISSHSPEDQKLETSIAGREARCGPGFAPSGDSEERVCSVPLSGSGGCQHSSLWPCPSPPCLCGHTALPLLRVSKSPSASLVEGHSGFGVGPTWILQDYFPISRS